MSYPLALNINMFVRTVYCQNIMHVQYTVYSMETEQRDDNMSPFPPYDLLTHGEHKFIVVIYLNRTEK